MAAGNKANKQQQAADDDDGDTDDKKKLVSLMKSFRDQSQILDMLFDFTQQVMTADVKEPQIILQF